MWILKIIEEWCETARVNMEAVLLIAKQDWSKLERPS